MDGWILLFSNLSELPLNFPAILTTKGKPLEVVPNCKYLGFLMVLIYGTYCKICNQNQNEAWLRKLLVSATFLPLLNYTDVLYMSASTKCQQPLNTGL